MNTNQINLYSRTRILVTSILAFLLPQFVAFATPANGSASVAVDNDGVMRWTANGEELALFGVNYTAPFAHAYRAHHRLGVDLEAAIDADVYHMARLGLNAYRIHIWDREISDPQGNLVVNDHVDKFDYLLAQLKKRGIKIIITPLQFGNAAYPEGGVPLDGFSSNYGKAGCLEDETSWPLQERYLAQFVSHVNPHTGLAYKDDPDIVAFEICNEPGHFEYDLTKSYINRMVAAIRDTGCDKPIFYNMSHGLPVFEAYLDANVQGGTFQWYPANLVANHEQFGNFLPYVDDYPIPFADHPKFKNKAKMVYEFDAADIGRSYIYPAIARTYRKAGMQFATMFAYDPMAIAPVNTEYQTHYMNLAYAPSKALGLMVAAEAFRRVPRGHNDGAYPANLDFEGVHISYQMDLAELCDETAFLYSNTTETQPNEPDKLTQIAGFGSSPIVSYPGKGAYFLDRVQTGVWRLEVMPDAIWVRDPFEKPNPEKQVSRIAWNSWPITIQLPDLGTDFSLKGINDGNASQSVADHQTVKVQPGTYLLTAKGTSFSGSLNDRLAVTNPIQLNEFVAPPASIDRTWVLHTPPVEADTGHNLIVSATVVSDKRIDTVELLVDLPSKPVGPEKLPAVGQQVRAQPGGGNTPGVGEIDRGGYRVFEMTPVSGKGYEYSATIPATLLQPGEAHYHIAVKTAEGYQSWPSELKEYPKEWKFYGEAWTARIVRETDPILLFEAADDHGNVTADFRDVGYELVPSDRPGTDALEMQVHDLSEAGHDHSFRFFFAPKVSHRTAAMPAMKELVFFGSSGSDSACTVQLSLISDMGIAYGKIIEVQPGFARYAVPISELRQVRSPNIPHGYPVFIPFWSSVENPIPLDLNKVESVMVSIGPGIPESEYTQKHTLILERIWLQ